MFLTSSELALSQPINVADFAADETREIRFFTHGNLMLVRTVAKSNFQKGRESLRRFRAKPQLCPTFSEITFGNRYS